MYVCLVTRMRVSGGSVWVEFEFAGSVVYDTWEAAVNGVFKRSDGLEIEGCLEGFMRPLST